MLPPTTLTRHAVCLGMTGSGKTGLCLSLLEDLALAGTPILALDPKGDLTNLALVFPTLDAAAFQPWVDPSEARRRNITIDALAEETAARWRTGLAAANLGPDDLAAWRERVEVIVMTPGSDAGRPVDVLTALTRAPAGLREDPEGLRGYVTGTVGALLGLVGEPADPLTDPGAILLARLLGDAFAEGRDMPLDALLPQIVEPPFEQLGYFPVDDVLPRKARMALALKLNNMVASPAFASWRTGDPLDLDAWTAPHHGKVPVRVLVLAHLSDAERMFFVTLLLHAVVAWTRRLPGTGDLRALLYFDEVMGYLPPHPKDPPSKGPVLTLMKQARAVGVGVMLATQNPVDIDYKALSNAGTWLIGRLQTENDRDRVLEGLITNGASLERKDLSARLAALPPRAFVVRDAQGNVGELTSRCTMSFLRGPLTRHELVRLLPARGPAEEAGPVHLGAPPPAPEGVAVRWLHPDGLGVLARMPPPEHDADWRFAVYFRIHARFDDEDWVEHRVIHRLLLDGTIPMDVALDDLHLEDRPPGHGRYPMAPARFDQAGELTQLREAWLDAVSREESAWVLRDLSRLATSRPGESVEEFCARVGVADPSSLTKAQVPLERHDLRTAFYGVVWVPRPKPA